MFTAFLMSLFAAEFHHYSDSVALQKYLIKKEINSLLRRRS